jgi:hypothetical protein
MLPLCCVADTIHVLANLTADSLLLKSIIEVCAPVASRAAPSSGALARLLLSLCLLWVQAGFLPVMVPIAAQAPNSIVALSRAVTLRHAAKTMKPAEPLPATVSQPLPSRTRSVLFPRSTFPLFPIWVHPRFSNRVGDTARGCCYSR